MSSFSKVLAACSSFLLCAALVSCSGVSKPAQEGDFSLTSTPTTIALLSGGAAQQISVSATPVNGFAGMVTVAITGLPTGVTAQPAMLTLTPGTPQNVTVTAAAAAVSGSATLTFTGTSGTLTHSATVAATITAPPPPDFTLILSPTSLTIMAGAAGSQVSVTATALNSFSGTVAVAITGLPTGVTAQPATLSLTPGITQSTTLTAAITTPAATPTITFTGTSGTLTHSAILALSVQAAPMTNAPDVTTYHYDVARDGLNAKETILTQTNVNSAQFGKIGFDTVDGKVDAQPLYLANVIIAGQLHNVLYVASEHGSVYAFDADSGAQIWKTSILGSGETTSDNHNCSQITPEIGITSTPVIDRKQGANGTIFTVGMSKDASGKYHQRLHALDITTGAEISGSPTEITASYPGTGDNTQNGNVIFDPSQYAERAALLLLNGNIYTGWTSHCDAGLYTGWVMAYSESTLQQTQLLNLTPNGHEGSIWMTGDGMAADSNGFIYLLDANGTFDTTFDANGFPANGDYGNAMVKLSTNGKLAVVDYFETYNTNAESADDLDLGSGGELLLPDQTDANGHVFHLIVAAGKDTNIYLANRDNMGKFNPANNPMDSNIYQELPRAMAGLVYSTPAYFNGVLYYAADGDTLKAFPLTNAVMATAPSSHSAVTFQHPGPTPSISANGTQNGIVWALESTVTAPGVLHAYDPANLAHEFYNSNQAVAGRDSFGNGNKFITPMIVNGKVYVGTQTGIAVFGLLPN
jgi:outer membrane protein assembly factor BamB